MQILIKNVMILTMEIENIIQRGYIKIEGNRITEVGEGDYPYDLEGFVVIDGNGKAAMPGLINCHTHVPMTLLRGYGEGLPLMRWLNEKIWPFEAKLNSKDIYNGASLGILEMLRSGTTTFVDMYFHEDSIADACEYSGIRGFLGSPLIGDAWESQIDETFRLYEKFKDNERIKIMIAPHSPYTCSFEALKKSGELARESKMPIHIHVSETQDEINIIKEKYGKTPVELLNDTGLYNKNNVIAAHCVHLTDDDIKIIKEFKVNPVYNPVSNMKLASGVSPVGKMLKSGINVAVGTDGASSNNNLDLIEEIKIGSLLQKLNSRDATLLNAFEALLMVTVNGAKAIGMEKELGKIKEGYIADIILINIDSPHMIPLYDVYSNIVFSANGLDVSTVIADGKIILRDGLFTELDEERIKYEALDTIKNILNR